MESFVSEYVHADFNHGGVIRHKTKRLKKTCYDKNNSRNRDILTRSKAQGTAIVFSQLNDKDDNLNEMDSIIDRIDKKKQGFSEEEIENNEEVFLHEEVQKKK